MTESWAERRRRQRLEREERREAEALALRDMYALRDVPPPVEVDAEGWAWAPVGWAAES